METLLQHLLLSSTETEVLEFKEAKNQYSKDKLGEYFSALSNEANLKGKQSAWILLGVNNNKEIEIMLLDKVQKNKELTDAEKQDIVDLLFDQLPKILNEHQKNNKLHNLINSLSKKEKLISNIGTNRYPKWVKL